MKIFLWLICLLSVFNSPANESEQAFYPFIQTHYWDLEPLWDEPKNGYALFLIYPEYEKLLSAKYIANNGLIFPHNSSKETLLSSSAWGGILREMSDRDRSKSAIMGKLENGTYSIEIETKDKGKVKSQVLYSWQQLPTAQNIQINKTNESCIISWDKVQGAFSYYVILAPEGKPQFKYWKPISSQIHGSNELSCDGISKDGRFWVIVRSNFKWSEGGFWALGGESWGISRELFEF